MLAEFIFLVVILTIIDGTKKRIHLATPKDIRNIENSFGLGINGRRHDDDSTSVKLWIDEMKLQETTNPVLLHEHTEHDFILVLQTKFQAEMLANFASQKVVCVDDTHGTNAYGFTLTTLMVVDEYGEGFPAAWSISNKNDTETLIKFFQAVKVNSGELNPLWFMSDDANQYYNAWATVFDYKPTKLLCSWHVLRAWKQNLKSIKDVSQQEDVFQELRVIMDQTNNHKCHKMLENAVSLWKCDSSTKKFAEYFEKYYKCRLTQWASCYRINSEINTNMFVESFHHVFKYRFLKGKNNRRLDGMIYALLEYIRFKTFDRLIKQEKGKISARVATIHKRHKESESLSHELVSRVNDTFWIVKSCTKDQFQYTVEKKCSQCPQKCQLRCPKCNICVHEYECTCPDYQVLHTICKHVHLVLRHTVDESEQSFPKKHFTPETTQLNSLISNVMLNETTMNPNLVKTKIVTLLKEIESQISNNISFDTLKSVESLLVAANKTLSSGTTEVDSFKICCIKSANSKVEKQRPFKKQSKRTRKTVRYARPSVKKRSRIEAKLLGLQHDAACSPIGMNLCVHCI